jgi:predicted ATPase
LLAAAVCGVEFRARTVAYSVDRDAAAVDEKCGQLAHEQLWLVAPRSGGGSDATDLPYSFRHALVRQLLYERIGPLARAELHLKVGRALERERAAGVLVSAAELAMHFERGRESITALRYYAEAAQAALLHLARPSA